MRLDAIASLSVTRVAANAHATKHLLMLHGIYGRGRNWQGIARALTASRDDYVCWLVDLPHHGDSGAGTHGDTVHGLAADVADWVADRQVTPTGVLGHSYGGKVALALAQRLANQPLQIWVIDSSPEVKEPAGSAWTMLEVIQRLPARFATRDEAVAAIVAAGYPVGVAQWMSTNLIREHNEFVWRLDFATMERLLRDFFTTDLWAVIETPAPQHEIHVVKASESNAITADAVRRLELAAGARMHLHHRPGGHWLHAESPEVVTRLLIEHLP
jgi:pimeloyl-ACP methyl ester carboxylesterase